MVVLALARDPMMGHARPPVNKRPKLRATTPLDGSARPPEGSREFGYTAPARRPQRHAAHFIKCLLATLIAYTNASPSRPVLGSSRGRDAARCLLPVKSGAEAATGGRDRGGRQLGQRPLLTDRPAARRDGQRGAVLHRRGGEAGTGRRVLERAAGRGLRPSAWDVSSATHLSRTTVAPLVAVMQSPLFTSWPVLVWTKSCARSLRHSKPWIFAPALPLAVSSAQSAACAPPLVCLRPDGSRRAWRWSPRNGTDLEGESLVDVDRDKREKCVHRQTLNLSTGWGRASLPPTEGRSP